MQKICHLFPNRRLVYSLVANHKQFSNTTQWIKTKVKWVYIFTLAFFFRTTLKIILLTLKVFKPIGTQLFNPTYGIPKSIEINQPDTVRTEPQKESDFCDGYP